jgi:aconitate hydratase
VRANYLMSPPLVVAYALAGRIDIDLAKEPLGTDPDGQPVFSEGCLADQRRGGVRGDAAVKPEHFKSSYAVVFEGDERWRPGRPQAARPSRGTIDSTYVKHPPYFEGMPPAPPATRHRGRAGPGGPG